MDKSDLSKMRVEPYASDSIVHAIKRGARGMLIVRDERDKRRFARLLFYANDTYRDEYWERNTKDMDMFYRPAEWPERQPLVKILSWSLMSNHFHLVLKEVNDRGISKFMQKLCGSISTHFNAKYTEKGSVFQGSYKGRTANTRGDDYLKLLAVYVMIKNPFELYRGGLKNAIQNFDEAYKWASQYPYCNLGDYTGYSNTPITEKDVFGEIFTTPLEFKEFARESLNYKLEQLVALELDKSDLSKKHV